jgi:hypothetical protein
MSDEQQNFYSNDCPLRHEPQDERCVKYPDGGCLICSLDVAFDNIVRMTNDVIRGVQDRISGPENLAFWPSSSAPKEQ